MYLKQQGRGCPHVGFLIHNMTQTVGEAVPNTSATTGTKPKRRWRSGVVATREIRKLSKSTDNIFPKAPFDRLVRELSAEISKNVRFSADGMQAIHEAAEQFVTDRIIKADLARKHANRQTLHLDDLHFAEYMTPITSELVQNKIFQKEVKEYLEAREAREAKANAKLAAAEATGPPAATVAA